MLALEGIRILDFSGGYPGSFGTWILGDLGAEVINIDAPPQVKKIQLAAALAPEGVDEKTVAAYDTLNRNKKSIRLNLKSEEGRDIFCKLAGRADVIVEGFRPGVVKRLGIDYLTISKINPRIIYCSLSGYGQDGPYSNLPGHDINYISMAGALSLIGNKDGPPVIPLNFLADFCGGPLFATIGILAALVAREKTGKGQYLDINYVDGIIALLKDYSAPYFQYGAIPKRGETMLSGGVPYINVYETKDGGFISIACFEPWLWENLCRAIGKEEFIPFHQEPEHLLRSPEGKEWDKIRSYLKQVFLTKSRDEWFHFLSQKDIPVGKVYSLDEVFSDPQVLHRNMVIEVDHPTVGKVKQIGIPIKLSDTPGKVRSPSPTLGEHHEEILVDLGYDKQTVDELRRKGIVG